MTKVEELLMDPLRLEDPINTNNVKSIQFYGSKYGNSPMVWNLNIEFVKDGTKVTRTQQYEGDDAFFKMYKAAYEFLKHIENI